MPEKPGFPGIDINLAKNGPTPIGYCKILIYYSFSKYHPKRCNKSGGNPPAGALKNDFQRFTYYFNEIHGYLLQDSQEKWWESTHFKQMTEQNIQYYL
ncbi:hypothetical protein [Desulforhopalus singaporensis]|uniref:hypothetical protein n=1 Tax=Desulforhopalus singaporensis TaxID=91360 RepID=UPI000B83AA2D|nr:hypothetical protein [Desulforhopalus singaporensis]